MTKKIVIVVVTLFANFYLLNAQKNLIANGNFNYGAKWFTSEYKYINDGNMSQGAGEYFIAEDAHLVHSQWDGKGINGNFLLVDGASAGDGYFWQQTATVQKNKKYTFQISLQTVSDPESYEQAKIGVYVNDVLTKTLTAPEIYSEWEHHQFTISAKTNVLKITLKVLNPGWIGIDFGVDEIGLFSGTNVKQKTNKDLVVARKKNIVKPSAVVGPRYEEVVSAPEPPMPMSDETAEHAAEVVKPVEAPAPTTNTTMPTYNLYTCTEEEGVLEIINIGREPIEFVIVQKNEKNTLANVKLAPMQLTKVSYTINNGNKTMYIINYQGTNGSLLISNCSKKTNINFTAPVNTAILNLVY
jgi:hypothetical protein